MMMDIHEALDTLSPGQRAQIALQIARFMQQNAELGRRTAQYLALCGFEEYTPEE